MLKRAVRAVTAGTYSVTAYQPTTQPTDVLTTCRLHMSVCELTTWAIRTARASQLHALNFGRRTICDTLALRGQRNESARPRGGDTHCGRLFASPCTLVQVSPPNMVSRVSVHKLDSYSNSSQQIYVPRYFMMAGIHTGLSVEVWMHGSTDF
jgi:hypothetical protein